MAAGTLVDSLKYVKLHGFKVILTLDDVTLVKGTFIPVILVVHVDSGNAVCVCRVSAVAQKEAVLQLQGGLGGDWPL